SGKRSEPAVRRRSRQGAGRSSGSRARRGEERPLWRLCHRRRRQRYHPERVRQGQHHDRAGYRADRRACSQRRRQRQSQGHKDKGSKSQRRQDRCGDTEAGQKGGSEKGCRQAEIGCHPQGACAGGNGGQDIRGKTCAGLETGGKKERRKGSLITVKKTKDNGFPDREAIVAFIRQNPGKVGTREIAREFGLKNADRAELKRILRELADVGSIKKHGRKLQETEALPPTVVADITGRDRDGELIATPTEWDEVENGEPPKIRIHLSRRARPSASAGVGDRALLHVESSDE